MDENLDHLHSLSPSYLLSTGPGFNSNDMALDPFFALVDAYRELEDRYQLTSDALINLMDKTRPFEDLLWTLVDVPIQPLVGTCGDGSPVQTTAQTYQVASLESESVESLTRHLVSLHSLAYSNLPDIDTKCEIWSGIIKLRCMELVKRSTSASKALSSSSAPSPSALGPKLLDLKSIKSHLEILFYFEKRSTKALRESNLVSSSNLSSSADISSTQFLECIRWCIKYLSFTYNRFAAAEEHTWLLDQLAHARGVSSWGQDVLQIQGMLSTLANDPFGQGLAVAKSYSELLKRVLSPVVDVSALKTDPNSPAFQDDLKMQSAAVRTVGAADIFIWTELDFLGLASQISLGPFLNHLTEAICSDASLAASSDPMETVGRAASAFDVLENLLHIISGAIPLIIFHLPSFAKKLADMLVKCANMASTTSAKLVSFLTDPGASSLVKSKADQLQYRAFAVLISQPLLWQFLVHLDLANASLELISCMFSYLYFNDPLRISAENINFPNWKREVDSNPAIRSTMVGRISENATSSYFVYFLVRVLKTHLGHGEFVQVLLYEMFSLAYTVDASAATLQKDVREQLLPVLNSTTSLISFWLRLTDWHLQKLAFSCFHPWKGIDLQHYKLPDEDIPILNAWLLAADGAPEHYLARFVISSLDLGNKGAPIHDPSAIEVSQIQHSVAVMIQLVWHSFATSSSRSSSSIDSFCNFCNSILLRTFHFNYSRFYALARSFDEGIVLASANAFTKGSRNGYCTIDPVSAFGLIEMTGLAGGYLGDNRASSPLPLGVPPSTQDSPTSFEISLRAFFDCGVPTLASLVSGNMETCARLLFDLTSIIAPFIGSLEQFSSDWLSPFFEPFAKFANTVVIPFLQIPSVLGSMVSLVRGGAASRSIPPLKSIIHAQYLLCHRADQEARSFHSHDSPAPSFAYLDSSDLGLESAHPASCPRTTSLLSFWLTSLLLANDWYRVPQVLDAVESVLTLFHAANLFPLALAIIYRADAHISSKEAPVAESAKIGRIPTVLLTVLGPFSKDKGLFSSLFGSSTAATIEYPWVLAALLQTHLDSLNWGDIGAAAATAAVPGQSIPMSLTNLRQALASLQPIFEATIRCLLVLEPSHPASIAVWNCFARIYFAHCLVNNQTLFYGHFLFLTSAHKNHRDRILARLNHSAQALKSSSSPANTSSASSNAQDPFHPPDEAERLVTARELLGSLDTWLRLELYKFNDLPELLGHAPMSSWLAAAMEFPATKHWVARAPRFAPSLSTHVSVWSLFLQKPSKDIVKVEAYVPTTKTTVDLMELLKCTSPARADSIQLLRSQRKTQFQDQRSADTLGSSATDSEIPDTSSADQMAFNVDDDSFLKEASSCLNTMQEQFSEFVKRKNLHWQVFDKRLLALQAFKRNQPQLAVAKAQCRLKDKCKAPAEFQVNISNVVIDREREAELKETDDSSQHLFQVALKRNQEPIANRNAVRFVLTMYEVFGSSESMSIEESNTFGKEKTKRLIDLYWMLRSFHSAGSMQYPPMIQVFEMLERQLLEKVVTRDALQVEQALSTLVGDPWASQTLCGSWTPYVHGPVLLRMYELLWLQPLPHLLPQSRAILLEKFKIENLLQGHPNDEARLTAQNRIVSILQTQILQRSPMQMMPSSEKTLRDELYEMALIQLTSLARLDFPSNLAPVMQFIIDESKNRTLAPSAWSVIINLPLAGLSAQKTTSVIKFCFSYLDLFKKHNPTNHLALWSPYVPQYIVFLSKLTESVALHLHFPANSAASTTTSSPMSRDSSYSSIPDSPSVSSATDTSRSTPPPVQLLKSIELSTVTSLLDLYSLWITPLAESKAIENWDTNTEPLASMLAASLQRCIFHLAIGPTFVDMSSVNATGKYNRDIWTIPRFDRFSSPQSLPLTTHLLKYILDLLKVPTSPQRLAVLERTPFENIPLSLISRSRSLLQETLLSLKRLMLSSKHSGPLTRILNRLFINVLPELPSAAVNPLLSSVPFDDEILSTIIDMSVIGMTYSPLPFTSEEKNFWSLLPALLPWDRLSGRRFLRSDFCSTLDVDLSMQGPADAQSPLRQLCARVRSYCETEKVRLTSSSGCDVARASENPKVPETDRLLHALWFLRSIAHLPSSTSQPTAITILGLTSVPQTAFHDWQTAESALRMCRIVETTFSAQSLLLAPATSLEESALWGENSPGFYMTAMLRYLIGLQSHLFSLPSASLSSDIRSFLNTRFGVFPHAPDAVVYPVLWSHILSAVASSIVSSFNYFELASTANLKSSGASSSKQDGAGPASSLPFWENRLISVILRFARENPVIATILVPAILPTIKKPLTAALLVEGLLENDWIVHKDMSRLCHMVALASPTVLKPTSPTSSTKTGVIGNMVELRQHAFSIGGAVTLTAICHQALSRFSSSSAEIAHSGAPMAESDLAVLQLEPEVFHWALNLPVTPGKEYQILGLWFETIQYYLTVIHSNAVEMQSLIGATRKVNYVDQLFKVAQHIYGKANDDNGSSLLRFIGLKSAAPSTPFRVAAQLLALFVFEHLLETPILGPGNKVIAYNVSLADTSVMLHATEKQIKRKESLVKSTGPKQPNAAYASVINQVLQFISRPQKSLTDAMEMWKLVAPLLGNHEAQMLQSLLQ